MTSPRISTLAALCLLAACLPPGPARAQSFQGTFTGEGVMITLQPARDRYSGTLVFDDEFYSIEAEEEAGELTGSFVTAEGEFDFRATVDGDLLELETNSITYVLRRAGQGARGEPDPEPAAVASEPVASTSEPAAPEAGAGGVIASIDFEDGEAPAAKAGGVEEGEGSRPARTPADSHGLQPEAAGSAEPAAGGPVDEALVGLWRRGSADAGGVLAGVTDLELDAAGTFAAGDSGGGLWKVERTTLYLRPAGAGEWRRYCRYKVVADTLLCTVGEDSRELWFRH